MQEPSEADEWTRRGTPPKGKLQHGTTGTAGPPEVAHDGNAGANIQQGERRDDQNRKPHGPGGALAQEEWYKSHTKNENQTPNSKEGPSRESSRRRGSAGPGEEQPAGGNRTLQKGDPKAGKAASGSQQPSEHSRRGARSGDELKIEE